VRAGLSSSGQQRPEARVEPLAPGGDRADRVIELVRVAALEREARGARAQAVEQLGLGGLGVVGGADDVVPVAAEQQLHAAPERHLVGMAPACFTAPGAPGPSRSDGQAAASVTLMAAARSCRACRRP
jgi:hypothetical protein